MYVDVASTIYSVQLGAGLVMIDTGCRRACGGRLWHERLREELDARGVRWDREESLEYFQFGPGELIASHARWTYNVGIYELDLVSTAIDQAPGLIGPEELAKWQGNIYFTDGTVGVRPAWKACSCCVWAPMHLPVVIPRDQCRGGGRFAGS